MPTHPLSDAIAEVLRSPFHSDRGFPVVHTAITTLAAG